LLTAAAWEGTLPCAWVPLANNMEAPSRAGLSFKAFQNIVDMMFIILTPMDYVKTGNLV
jgi:hypothetical protein